MKISRIKYKNYRCFKDVDIQFDTNTKKGGKNINLIVAHNGGGKTEMLFSFWWVLYGFDFKSLKNKDATPWALNSKIYFELLGCYPNTVEECSVDMWFEVDGQKYHITRTEKFIKKKKDIAVSQLSVCLAETTDKGETLPPLRDIDKVNGKLKKILPPHILYGILFDGERMKQLAANDETSRMAVETIIKYITNQELFSLISQNIDEIIKKNNKDYKKAGSLGGNTKIAELTSQIQFSEKELENKKTQIKANEVLIKKYDNRLAEIHLELEQHQESKILEAERKYLQEELRQDNDHLAKQIDIFSKELESGYLLITNKLIQDVHNLLDVYDIPAGLTTYAVKSILSRPVCICGNCLSEKEKAILESLLSSLPPDNINSTINEMIRSIEKLKNDAKSHILDKYKDIEKLETKISEKKDRIAEISTQISEGSSAKINKLEKENQDLLLNKIKKEESNRNALAYINDLEEEIARLKKERTDASRSIGEYKFFESKDIVLNKFKFAMELIDLYSKQNSLEEINEILDDSYQLLSEDAPRGKKLYIIQFDKEKMYQMVSYYQTNYDNMYRSFQYDGTISNYQAIGLSEDMIKEKVILAVADSNSTGQSKINALAFAKSILTYSSIQREENAIEITRSYPFIIDSPFTEISDDNLYKSASNIHLFTDQIILMISSESLEGIKKQIAPHVAKEFYLVKDENESCSYLKS